ncbi:lipopolysaccharide biosynthesis protein [Olivibacter sp. LS-1]|uniref:lipopolysaccharide biosynthesis protein n=1 Tax=unclassified Olivibacter TaxID=2632301 RepID=UPI0011EA893C|nr:MULTISPECIES: lipopolysaccharide biosynthesis protein [unclassified Olivibacter]MDM8177217.1 lipopolysaccharide biosynthesis protein [Olivibacter sp. 47]QEL00375.1 lipopolysaccharide biosynthesis protein [Olivibacter sp. LS-1]
MLKKLFSHTLIYGLAPQIVKVAQVLVLPLITPFLSPKDYGVFGIITAVVGAVSVLSTLGLNIALANSFTRSPNRYKWLWRQVYGFLIFWNYIYAILIACIIFSFIPEEAKENTIPILSLNVIPLILFAPSTNIGSLYYQLNQKPFQIAMRSVLIGCLTVGLNVYFIKYLRMGYMGWFWANAISQVVYQFSYFIPLNYHEGIKPIYNFKRKTLVNQLKVCLPTIPHFYSTYLLTSFDRVIMKFLGISVDGIGKYNAAQVPGNLFGSATYAANQAISPLLLNSYKRDDKNTERKLNFVVAIVFLVATSIICLFLKELLPLVIKSKGLENIYPISIIIIMAYNYRPMYIAANNRLFYVEKTKALLKVTTIAAFLSVVLNLLLIYFYGSMSAAVTLFISFMYMGYSGFFIKEFKESKGTNHYPLFWMGITVALTIFVYLAVEFSWVLKICIAITILLAGLTGMYLTYKKHENSNH